MRKLTVHLHIWFQDVAAASTDDASDAIKQALFELRDRHQEEFEAALEAIGASSVSVETVVF